MNEQGYRQKHNSSPFPLVVVLVAKCLPSGIKDISDLDIRPDAIHVDACVERQRVAVDIGAINGSCADGRVLVLPNTEVAVDETLSLLSVLSHTMQWGG